MALPGLGIRRVDALLYVAWLFVLGIGSQSMLPIFLNFRPLWDCEGVGNFSRDCDLAQSCQGNLSFQAAYSGAVEEFRLLCGERAYYAALTSTVFFLGMLVGALVFGQLSDSFGRKWPGIATLSLAGLANVVVAVAPNWQTLLAGRLLAGMGASGCLTVLFTYVMEIIPPHQRLFLRGFFNWGWGRLILTVVAYLLPYWRHLATFFALLPLPLILFFAFVMPESPIWLASHGRSVQLHKALGRLAWLNGHGGAEVREEKASLEAGASSGGEKVGVKELLTSPALAKITLTLWVMWFAASLSSYANDLNSGSLAGELFLNQILFSLLIGFSKPLIFFADFYFPAFSRRLLHQSSQTFVLLTYGAIIALLAVNETYAQPHPQLRLAVTVLSLIGTVAIEYTWDACYVCGAEAFPTSVRSLGLGSSSVMARVGAMVAPNMIFLGQMWSPAPYVTVAVIGAASLVISFLFLPETKGTQLSQPLPSLTIQEEIPMDESKKPML